MPISFNHAHDFPPTCVLRLSPCAAGPGLGPALSPTCTGSPPTNLHHSLCSHPLYRLGPPPPTLLPTLLRALSAQAWAMMRELRRSLLPPAPGFLGPSSPGLRPVTSVGTNSCGNRPWWEESGRRTREGTQEATQGGVEPGGLQQVTAASPSRGGCSEHLRWAHSHIHVIMSFSLPVFLCQRT